MKRPRTPPASLWTVTIRVLAFSPSVAVTVYLPVGILGYRTTGTLLSKTVLEVVEKVCARVIILHRGRVMADDSVESLRELMNLPSLGRISFELIEPRDLEGVARAITPVVETRS